MADDAETPPLPEDSLPPAQIEVTQAMSPAIPEPLAQLEHLSGPGFRLTPIEEGDAERLRRLAEDADFKHWLPWIRGGYTASTAWEFASQFASENWASGQPVWAIRIEDELVGVLDLRNRGGGTWEVGFWMHPDWRGKGLMTQANVVVAAAAFERLGVQRLLHFARVGNYPSIRVAQKLGFTFEGIRRKYTNLGIEHQWQSALLRSDWTRSVAQQEDSVAQQEDPATQRENSATRQEKGSHAQPELAASTMTEQNRRALAEVTFRVFEAVEEALDAEEGGGPSLASIFEGQEGD